METSLSLMRVLYIYIYNPGVYFHYEIKRACCRFIEISLRESDYYKFTSIDSGID